MESGGSLIVVAPSLFCLHTDLHLGCYLSLPHPSVADPGVGGWDRVEVGWGWLVG